MRPNCQVPGCDSFAQNTNTKAKPRWRKSKWVRETYSVKEGYICYSCHSKKIAQSHGFKRITQLTAKRQGLTVYEYQIKFHPYLKYRREKCENRDSRLGFKCTYKIVWKGQLQVDHIDGNPYNNDPTNLQTLCANCHAYKTHISGDGKTLGRKSLKKLDNHCQV